MHLVDSTAKSQPDDRGASSPPLPEQSLPSAEKLTRENDGVIEVINVAGAEIRMRKFLAPDGEGPVALYLHGIEGHSLWFANTADWLNKAGISVYAPDRRGAGLNTHQRGHVEDAEILLKDLEFFLDLVSRRHPSRPLFLMANCWGAKVATVVASKQYKWSTTPIVLDGLVLICPAIQTKPDLTIGQKLSIAAALVSGKKALQAEIPIPLTCSMFTDNPLFLNYIDRDPLRLVAASKSFYFASFLLSFRSQRTAVNLDLPTLVLQSDNDDIVDVPGLKTWFDRIANADKTLKIYSGAAHSLDFDKRHFADYAREISDWIIRLSAKRGSNQ